jgi:hypothetical protein
LTRYDSASAQVHPTSDEGEADFEILTQPPGTVALPSSIVVTNSILIHTMLVQEALNISEMRWHALVYDFLDQMHLFLKTGEQQFQLTMREIASVLARIAALQAAHGQGGRAGHAQTL